MCRNIIQTLLHAVSCILQCILRFIPVQISQLADQLMKVKQHDINLKC